MADDGKQWNGALAALDAARAIRAARLNALALADTAELLFNLKRFSHSLAFSILAIEECAKQALLLTIFTDPEADIKRLWRDYRQHRAKTKQLGEAITSRIRAAFPDIPVRLAKMFGEDSPKPDQLEELKQRALYSDVYVCGEYIQSHEPSVTEFREQAEFVLADARAFALGLRDLPPEELEVWRDHLTKGHTDGRGPLEVMKGLHSELIARGFIRKGQWDITLADLTAEAAEASAGGTEKA